MSRRRKVDEGTIYRVLQDTNGNYTQAARILGISCQYVHAVVKRAGGLLTLGIELPRDKAERLLRLGTPLEDIQLMTGLSASHIRGIRRKHVT